MDIKDIKRAMDNMPMGDGSAFAEISVGPAKHEQFLDEHYGKVALVVLLCVLGAAGWIIYNGVQDSMERKAGAALVAAMPESPATGEISLDEQGLQQVVADFDSSRAAVTASYLQAIALWNAGKEDEGVAKMKAFIDSAPTEEWKAQASVTLAKKDNPAAGAFYRELAEKFPSSAFALQSGGYLLRKSLFDIQSPVRIEPAVEQK